MPLNLFELLFLVCVLATVATLATAMISALTGKWRRAFGILRLWAIAAVIYLAAAAASHLWMPLRVVYPHDPQCSDDWCVVVDGAGREAPGSETYRVNLRIYSRALRVEQRERGLTAYLTDGAGRRYDAEPSVSDVPFDTLLGPGESAAVVRRFRVPAAARRLDLSMVQNNGFPIGSLVIGRSPFDTHTVVRLD